MDLESVSPAAGDVNGDGYDDVIIGINNGSLMVMESSDFLADRIWIQ